MDLAARCSLSFLQSLALATVLTCVYINCEYWESDDNIDTSDWVNPGDMLRYDSTTKSMKPVIELHTKPTPREHLANGNSDKPVIGSSSESSSGCKCPNPTEKPKPECLNNEFHFYKRFIRNLLAHFIQELDLTPEEMQFDVRMVITEAELARLKAYVLPASKVAVQDVDAILTRLIHRVKLHGEYEALVDEGLKWPSWIKENALVILAVVSFVFAILIIRRLNATGVFILSIVVLVAASTIYEGINMYQKLEAEKFAEQKKLNYNIPEQCNPDNAGILRRMGWAIQTKFFGMDDPCKKYYELHMVDNKFKISPLMVLTTMLGRVMEIFAKFSGSSFGIFYSEAMQYFNLIGKVAIIVVATVVLITAIRYMGPALVYTLPSLAHAARQQVPTREMLQEIPPVQPQVLPVDPKIPQEHKAVKATCTHCHSQQMLLLEQPRPKKRLSPNRSTFIHIKGVQTLVIERNSEESVTQERASIADANEERVPVDGAIQEAATESDYESSSDVAHCSE